MTITNLHVFSHSNQVPDLDTLDVFDDCHYLQSLDWYQCHPENLLFVSKNDGDVTARSVVRMKKLPFNLGMLAFIDRGPVAKNKQYLLDHLENIKAYFKDKKCICIQCSPISYNDNEIKDVSLNLVQTNWNRIDKTLSLYKSTVVVNLVPDILEIKSQFRRSLKTQLNKSERLGITIDSEPENYQIQDFIHYYNIMAKKRGLAEIIDNTADYFMKSIAKGNTKLLLAYLDGKLISGAALVIQGRRVIYEWGMNTLDPQLKSLPLAHKMHWEAIKWSKQNGFKDYDMGGYWLSEGADNSINKFKLGFSKSIENVMPEFYFVVNHLRFSLFSLLLKLRGYLK